MESPAPRKSGRALVRQTLCNAAEALWEGENAEEYRALHEAILADIGPRDLPEEILAAEFAALTHEVRRLRALRSHYMRMMCSVGLRDILFDLVEDEVKADELANDSMRGHPSARRRVQSLLKQAGMGLTRFRHELGS